MSEHELMTVRADLGMVFQEGALFDSLTVRENVGYKLFEESRHAARRRATPRRRRCSASSACRSSSTGCRRSCPAGSGRRVAIARAMAAKPRILLYDEPTTGLDPITATTVDEEIIKLRDLEEVSSIVVTHQLRDAFYVATHMAVTARTASVRIVAGRRREGATKRSSSCCSDGRICFEGPAGIERRPTCTCCTFCRNEEPASQPLTAWAQNRTPGAQPSSSTAIVGSCSCLTRRRAGSSWRRHALLARFPERRGLSAEPARARPAMVSGGGHGAGHRH